MTETLLPTTVVGSYPQPDWLVDRAVLAQNLVPRVRMKQMWRVAEDALEQAQDDATLVAIRDMERAGIDIVTDGEIRRESYSNRFALALDGVDLDNPARTMGRAGKETLVPRVIGPIRRREAVELRDVEFLVANTDRRTKITLPGPFTLSQQAADEHYRDEEAMAMDYAVAVNEEAKALKRAGVDVIQFDEPWMQARPEAAARFGVKVLNRALEGIEGDTVVHLCFGYAAVVKDKPSGYSFLPQLAECRAAQISIEAAQPRLDLGVLDALPGKTIMLGVLDLGDAAVETPQIVAERIRAALRRLPAERLVVAPDCGMKYLPRERAFGKLKAMVEGAAIVRRELAG
ncbi:5-methyltetrahydropteroyltriglutamate--homocysteine methyltransferase [Pseudoroseomonas cervicalis]|uniref:5-methyltetrahydropteroyltriglutamate-- homocysteine methyltransferase n=1 Tax=Teichococcus cervicalis TaxID=204525 RepID=UPI0022F1DCC2|nr:5-methyltetrahydropteroyltriglutamate--homocysteine methyltransferase [Pseudoroseomonas cervicalis]WBV45480.1 5-methyltetrahydropteroyltriglutamate--homocysteine methyltransferase [Pseudoroseomonas cervicalis]